MPSIIKTILALAACMAMANANPVPHDSSPINVMFDKRADLETCPGINGKDVRAGRFRVLCNKDTQFDGDHAVVNVEAEDFDDCMGKCEGVKYRDWCRRAVFPGQINTRGTCYLKGKGTGDPVDRSGYKLALRY